MSIRPLDEILDQAQAYQQAIFHIANWLDLVIKDNTDDTEVRTLAEANRAHLEDEYTATVS